LRESQIRLERVLAAFSENVVIRDLIIKNRSCRRFRQNVPVERETLRELVDLARLSASAANMQPLKYVISCEAKRNAEIFRHIGWAGYLKGWPGPEEGQRPAAYTIILCDTQISEFSDCDHGIAAQSILLGAAEKGLAGCMIGTVRRKELSAVLDLPSRYKILLVIALGKPAEKVVLETVGPDGAIEYWRDADGVHHVPKRPLDELILDF
jgi:nitroreductase